KLQPGMAKLHGGMSGRRRDIFRRCHGRRLGGKPDAGCSNLLCTADWLLIVPAGNRDDPLTCRDDDQPLTPSPGPSTSLQPTPPSLSAYPLQWTSSPLPPRTRRHLVDG